MSQLNQALITLGRKMLIWCQHSDLIWTLSSCGTRIHQVSHAKMRCHVYFTRFLFSRTKALKLDSDYCILDYVLTFAPVVLVCLFFNTLQEIWSFFTTKQEETFFFFSYFQVLWKTSENFRNGLYHICQWKEWEIVLCPFHPTLQLLRVFLLCMGDGGVLISFPVSTFELFTFKYII